MAFNFKDIPQVRPAEIKTYHSVTYDRVSPSRSTFDAKGKTLFITAGGMFSLILQQSAATDTPLSHWHRLRDLRVLRQSRHRTHNRHPAP
jgi:hypothetical protein